MRHNVAILVKYFEMLRAFPGGLLYGAAFRSHRWDLGTSSGRRAAQEMAQMVVTLLQPYLQPDN